MIEVLGGGMDVTPSTRSAPAIALACKQIGTTTSSLFDGASLATMRKLSHLNNERASEEPPWKAMCGKKWKSQETDGHLWPLFAGSVSRDSPSL